MWCERGFFSLIGAMSTARPISIQVGKNSAKALPVQLLRLQEQNEKCKNCDLSLFYHLMNRMQM